MEKYDLQEVDVLNELTIPVTPATRLTDEHHVQLKRIARIPLMLMVLIAALFAAGFINPDWVPVLNLIALVLSAATVMFAGVFALFIRKARKTLSEEVQQAAETTTPLLKRKYDVDITEELVVSLMSGAALPLIVQGELMKVKLVNQDKQAKLMRVTSL